MNKKKIIVVGDSKNSAEVVAYLKDIVQRDKKEDVCTILTEKEYSPAVHPDILIIGEQSTSDTQTIVNSQNIEDCVVLSLDSLHNRELIPRIKGKILSVSQIPHDHAGVYVSDKNWFVYQHGQRKIRLFPATLLDHPEKEHWDTVLCCIAAAKACNIHTSTIHRVFCKVTEPVETKADVTTIRERYPEFTYEDFSWSIHGRDMKLSFTYAAPPDISFHPVTIIHNLPESIAELPKSTIETFVFHLGIIEMLSYWKATCSPHIHIAAGSLHAMQIDWWKDLLMQGMGEYFYKNTIDFTKENFIHITAEKEGDVGVSEVVDVVGNGEGKERVGYLVPVGGGKDSTVTVELLKRAGLPMTGFVVNEVQSAEDVLTAAAIPHVISIERQFDPLLWKLNDQGFYNGHTPYSAYLAFSSLFAAFLTGNRYVAVSNESGSKEETTNYLGHSINHQYSKTYDFEKKFREYTATYITKETEYFSSVRPLNEIQISKLFSTMPQYFKVFRSCNRGQKTNSWCCDCPKCLSTYILLYPFMKYTIETVFPERMYEKESLYPILQSLIDSSLVRPFECVGTREESMVGLYMSIRSFGTSPLPVLLQKAQDEYIYKESNLDERVKTVLNHWDDDNFVPEQVEKILKESISHD